MTEHIGDGDGARITISFSLPDTGPLEAYFGYRLIDELRPTITAVGGRALGMVIEGEVAPPPTVASLEAKLTASSLVVLTRTIANYAALAQSFRDYGVDDVRGIFSVGSERLAQLPRSGTKTIDNLRTNLKHHCPEIPFYRRPSATHVATFCDDPAKLPLFALHEVMGRLPGFDVKGLTIADAAYGSEVFQTQVPDHRRGYIAGSAKLWLEEFIVARETLVARTTQPE